MKEVIDAVNGMVRPVVTLALSGALVWGFIMDKIGGEAFLGVVGLVIGFWFNRRDEVKDK